MRAILTYHSIDPSGSVISMTEEAFRRHVRWLASGAARVVRLAELLELPPDEDAVTLTFDDGFDNFRTVVAPALAEHGLTATVFVVSQRVGGTNAWETVGGAIPILPLMGWDALGRLVEDGFEVGAHTRTHARLTTVASDRLHAEVAGSAEDIRRELGVTPSAFAYPYGAFGAAAEAAAVDAFPLVCTTELNALDADAAPTRLPRLDMFYYREPARLEAWGTPAFRRHLALRRAARRLRARLRRKESA
jgi:peptidoglycan/xylan/chitin deacetylase (PgdA/CDA1 family)